MSYTDVTLKKLYALSGNQCAFPNCEKELVNRGNAKNSNICHIEARNEGGQRYNSNMTDKERNDYPNLILLCIQHHDKTNDVEKYTVERLKQMKQIHESEVDERMSPTKKILTIAKVANKIAEIHTEKTPSSEVKYSFKPEDKIQYNNIKIYKPLFERYKIYSTRLNAIYDEMDAEGSLKKMMILQHIESMYLITKGELNSHENTQNHADKIIEKMENKLLNELENSNLDDFSIEFAIKIILTDAFIRCKILEEPKNDNR